MPISKELKNSIKELANKEVKDKRKVSTAGKRIAIEMAKAGLEVLREEGCQIIKKEETENLVEFSLDIPDKTFKEYAAVAGVSTEIFVGICIAKGKEEIVGKYNQKREETRRSIEDLNILIAEARPERIGHSFKRKKK